MYQILETRGDNFTTNAIHIQDREGRSVATIWEIRGNGQDELWERAQIIVDFLNHIEV